MSEVNTFTMCLTDNFNNRTEAIYKNNIHLDTIGGKFQIEVVCRGRFFASFIVSPFVGALDFVYSIILAFGLAFSRNYDKESFCKTTKYSGYAAESLSVIPYSSFLGFINPHAKLSQAVMKEKGIAFDYLEKFSKIVITGELVNKLLNGNFFQKHILNRLICIGGLLALTIAKIVDFVIGIFSAVVSIVLLGKSQTWNDRAARQLNLLQWAGISTTIFSFLIFPEKIKNMQ